MKRITLSTLFIFAMILATAQTKVETQPLSVVASEKNGKAEVRVTGIIHEWSQASATDLRYQVDELIEAGYQDATVYLNTKGGSTIEAAEIFNEIRRFKGKLTAKGGAIVASAGGWLACKCDTFEVSSNTQFMWHKPQAHVEGTYDEIIAQAKLVKNTEDDYLAVYSEKTKKSTEALSKLWDKGDQWLMGDDIVSEGFADKVIKKDAPVSQADVELLEAIGAPVVPVATSKPKKESNKNTEMKIDPISIGLSANATEAEIKARLNELQAAETSLNQLKKDKDEADAKAKAKSIEDLLAKANTDKKFGAEENPKWKTVLEANFDNGKALIEGLSSVPKLSSEIISGKTEGVPSDRKDWTFADWQTKDPEALRELHDNDLKTYNKLFEAQYKTK